MTRPRSSSSGPPELPGLIGASVWMTLSIVKPLGAWIVRPRPEMMPAVAVRSRPSGKPMAIALSPTVTLSESANVSGLSCRSVVGVDPQDGEVGGRVGADHLGVDAATLVVEDDLHLVGALHDVIVGDDRAVGGDDEATAGGPAPARERLDRDDAAGDRS